MNIRPLYAAHASEIAQIDARTRGVSAWSAKQWSPHLGPGQAFGAFVDGRLKGFAVFRCVLDEAELLYIAVRPNARRQKIAKKLLRHAMRVLSQRAIETVFLEVKAHNIPAHKLYRKFGFLRFGRRENYYRDGSDALLMRCALENDSEPATPS